MSAMPQILTCSSDAEPGICRRVRGKGFSFHNPDGSKVEDAKTLDRITTLAIPPAWRDVWICPQEHGHIQATGYDARDRKQYRYHDKWREHRDALKFASLSDFGDSLPALRQRVRRDLGRNRPDKDFVCAALVRLLDKAALRVGTDAYARENKTYGATTLRMKHLSLLDAGHIKLDFTAKGGKRVRKQITDRTLHRAMERIGDLKGYEVFHYLTEEGRRCGVDSGDVNAYLNETLDSDFSAKTFRTWHGTVAAFEEALEADDLTIKAMCERASGVLHNTPAICRSSYIHPEIIKLAEDEARARRLSATEKARRSGLRVAEARLLAFLD